MLTVITMMML